VRYLWFAVGCAAIACAAKIGDWCLYRRTLADVAPDPGAERLADAIMTAVWLGLLSYVALGIGLVFLAIWLFTRYRSH